MSKWKIEGWGAAQGQIREAISFLCDGKAPTERAEIADELVSLVRAMARGDYSPPQASPYERDEYERECWARASANHVIGGALRMSERFAGSPRSADQNALLREIARRALWHMPNATDEVRNLVRYIDLEKPAPATSARSSRARGLRRVPVAWLPSARHSRPINSGLTGELPRVMEGQFIGCRATGRPAPKIFLRSSHGLPNAIFWED